MRAVSHRYYLQVAGIHTHSLGDTHMHICTHPYANKCKNGSRRTNAKSLTVVSSGEGRRIGEGVKVKRKL